MKNFSKKIVPYVQFRNYLPYAKGLLVQKELTKSTSSNSHLNVVLLLQHPPTYTAGRRTKGTIDTEGVRLRNLGADYFEVNFFFFCF